MYNEEEDVVNDFLNATADIKKKEPEIFIDERIKNRLWSLTEDEYSKLEQQLKTEGCRDALVLWDNEGVLTLIDGHNRYGICKKFDIEYKTIIKHFWSLTEVMKWIDTNQLSRRNLTDTQRTLLQGRLSRTNKVENSGKVTTGTKVGQNVSPTNQQTVAKQLGVTTKTLQRSEDYLDAFEELEKNIGKETTDKIASEELKVTKQDVIKIAKLNPEKQKETIDKIKSGECKDLIEVNRMNVREVLEVKRLEPEYNKYRIIYADPPWSYQLKKITGNAVDHYLEMSLEDICSMPIKDITEDDAVLFLWVTSPLLEKSFQVIKSWGFEYKTSFVWDKVKHNMGHYNSVRHEFLLVCTKGSCTPDNIKLYDSVQSIERSDVHSEKPEEFRKIIEDIYTHGNKIELFSRTTKEGWSNFGNQEINKIS